LNYARIKNCTPRKKSKSQKVNPFDFLLRKAKVRNFFLKTLLKNIIAHPFFTLLVYLALLPHAPFRPGFSTFGF